MVYSALFSNVFEALKFVFSNIAEILLPGYGTRLLSITQSFGMVISKPSCKVQLHYSSSYSLQ
jgi:hypothetical protein